MYSLQPHPLRPCIAQSFADSGGNKMDHVQGLLSLAEIFLFGKSNGPQETICFSYLYKAEFHLIYFLYFLIYSSEHALLFFKFKIFLNN